MSTSDLRSFPSLPPCFVLCILAHHRHRRHHDNDDERRWCEIIDRNQIMRTRANNLFTDGEAESRGARRGHQDQYCHHHCHRHHRCHRHCHRRSLHFEERNRITTSQVSMPFPLTLAERLGELPWILIFAWKCYCSLFFQHYTLFIIMLILRNDKSARSRVV